MNNVYSNVTCGGMDVHHKFSNVTFRDQAGRVVRRERLNHPGRSPLGRHLGARGNRTLKWAFIEAAHGAVRSGARWRAMFDRVTCGGTKDRNRGYIKVARELVKVVYVVWAKGVDYQPLPPARPGRAKKQTSRSGTGQLLHPMVHALRG